VDHFFQKWKFFPAPRAYPRSKPPANAIKMMNRTVASVRVSAREKLI